MLTTSKGSRAVDKQENKLLKNNMLLQWSLQRDLPWELDSTLCTLGRTNLGNILGCAGSPANFGSHVRTFRQGACMLSHRVEPTAKESM